MRARAAAELLALPVRERDIDLGRPVDVLLDLERGRALGLEVRCRDETRRFLPLGAARIRSEALEVDSALTLLDDLAFYRTRASSLRSVRGTVVRRGGRPTGTLEDVVLREDGALEAFVVATPSGSPRIPLGPDVELETGRKVSAA